MMTHLNALAGVLRSPTRLKTLIWSLTVVMKHGYLGKFEITDDHRAGNSAANHTGRVSKEEV